MYWKHTGQSVREIRFDPWSGVTSKSASCRVVVECTNILRTLWNVDLKFLARRTRARLGTTGVSH